MPSIIKVKLWYAESFKELVEFPSINSTKPSQKSYYSPESDDQNGEWTPEAEEYNSLFIDQIQRIKRRHDPVVTTMAQGINELKERERFNMIPSEIQSFLDRFHLSRIGIRMVCTYHCGLTSTPSS